MYVCAHHQGPRDASEEAVQDAQHHHGERAVPWADAGGQGGRHARDQRRQPGAVQRHHPLVRNTPPSLFVLTFSTIHRSVSIMWSGRSMRVLLFLLHDGVMVCAGTASGR